MPVCSGMVLTPCDSCLQGPGKSKADKSECPHGPRLHIVVTEWTGLMLMKALIPWLWCCGLYGGDRDAPSSQSTIPTFPMAGTAILTKPRLLSCTSMQDLLKVGDFECSPGLACDNSRT